MEQERPNEKRRVADSQDRLDTLLGTDKLLISRQQTTRRVQHYLSAGEVERRREAKGKRLTNALNNRRGSARLSENINKAPDSSTPPLSPSKSSRSCWHALEEAVEKPPKRRRSASNGPAQEVRVELSCSERATLAVETLWVGKMRTYVLPQISEPILRNVRAAATEPEALPEDSFEALPKQIIARLDSSAGIHSSAVSAKTITGLSPPLSPSLPPRPPAGASPDAPPNAPSKPSLPKQRVQETLLCKPAK